MVDWLDGRKWLIDSSIWEVRETESEASLNPPHVVDVSVMEARDECV